MTTWSRLSPRRLSAWYWTVVEHPPERMLYTALKQSLLDSHQLTDYQKIAALHKMELLGGRKPSELLASMLELCP
jgi:hypothetical protein